MKLFLVFCILPLAATSSWGASGNPVNGKKLFTDKSCISCHAIGAGGTSTTGPNLAGVVQKRKPTWLKRWLKEPSLMKNDPMVREMNAKYHSQMPDLGLKDSEVEDLLAYIASVK